MIGYIYRLISPNGKSYVGQTIDIQRRFSEYNRYHCKNQPKLYRSILKYGIDNFEKEILFMGECTTEFLNDLEKYYISKYDSVINGLNLQFGGNNGLHSEETKLKMSKSALRLCEDKDYTKKRNSSWIGRKHKESSKRKMSKSRKGKKLNSEWVDNIKQALLRRGGKLIFNSETGIYYNSVREASDSCNYAPSSLRNMLNGYKKNKTSLINV